MHEQSLPGVGVRYDLHGPDGGRLYVIVDRDGRRSIGVPGPDDEPVQQVSLDPDEAVVVASLLLGARFSLDTRHDARHEGDEAVVDIVALGPTSSAVGLTQTEIAGLHAEAVVLAVLSGSTPEIVEDETRYRAQPGDRVVVAARAPDAVRIVEDLRG